MPSMRRHSRFGALALALFAPAAAHAAALYEMIEVTATVGILTTTIVVDEYTASFTEAVSGSAFSYKTRGYDPEGTAMTDRMAVGPTLRFSAGDSVKVTLDNDLDANPDVHYECPVFKHGATQDYVFTVKLQAAQSVRRWETRGVSLVC